jgi:hypothetical protein
VVSSATNSPATVSLAGTGVTVLVAVTPTTVDFGSVVANTSTQQSVTLQNTGAATVTISQAAVTGPGFSVSAVPMPFALPAGQSTSMSVSFAPTATGSASGQLSVISNASNSPTDVPLAGTGVLHAVDLSWSASTSTDVVTYNLYRSVVSGGPYQGLISGISAAITLAYTDATVQAGATYYYVATAVDSEGNESGYSNQVSAVVPSP